MDRVLRTSGLRWRFVAVPASLALCLWVGASGVPAQQAAAPGTVTNFIVANLDSPQSICPAVAPVIGRSPGAFSELVAASQSYPELLEPLGDCCAAIQTQLSSNDPAAAVQVSNILASGPAEFQAACAVSLADGGGLIAASSGAGTTGIGYGGSFGGGPIGGGGGIISPAGP